MPLMALQLPISPTSLPADVSGFLREADRRIEQFQQIGHVPSFVPSDYPSAYGVLQALARADLAPGQLFCEWGSGFGVVTCLAAMLGFEACGIEIERELVDAAQQLADDFGLPVEFYHGSFIPRGSEALVDTAPTFAWLNTDVIDSNDDSALAVDDFDIVFAYPWPDEEQLTDDLFERWATPGALLVTYHGGEGYRVQRKRRARRRADR
jgi:hypothetical protein